MPGMKIEHSVSFKRNHKEKFFEEILRQKCIFKLLPEQDKGAWFTYINRFSEQCFEKDTTTFKYYNSNCSNQILSDLDGLTVQDIDSCISTSFAEPGNYTSDNIMLAGDR